ncbi:DUF2877 domain-containing protein [Aeromonas hydrophila]|uniref:DUF2877 domain-containing protein n=1 Tax=Aeromonas hydrophila TaxID=644 RepID=UPI000760333B|nr:DUF2877 domain-containing protein [Aeromonas hydrophila]KWR66943.1 hypothetical protein ATO50_12760 [Aeromonas hydrophila]MBW3843942.1 DUF2877 domain-containing protein [Aeromonas hydrophila]
MSQRSLSVIRGCQRLLAMPKQDVLTVHSRFQRSCNFISDQGEWLTLVINGVALPPAGMELATGLLPDDMQPGSRWLWHENTLVGPHCKIRLVDCQWQSTRLTSGQGSMPCLLPSLDHFLSLAPPADGFWAQWHGADHDYLFPPLTALQNWLGGTKVELGPVLTPLLGYGHGLTPSGDDFLLGILFALEWTAFQGRDELIAALLPLLTRTTEISSVMLKMGTAGHYGERLLQLVTARKEDVMCAIKNIADYGHSSGHDMLCGIRFALANG